MDQESAFTTEKKVPSSYLIFILIFVALIVGGAGGYLLKPSPKTDKLSLPLDPQQAYVQSASILYLIKATVKNIDTDPLGGYRLQLQGTRGENITTTFSFKNNSVTIVKLDSAGKENPAAINDIKNGTPLYVNYYIDLKNQSVAQLTKIALLP